MKINDSKLVMLKMIKVRSHLYVLIFISSITSSIAESISDWRPIVGPSNGILKPQQSIQYPTVIDGSGFHAASSSKSTITFNGQTITTTITDNNGVGQALSVESPDLSSEIDNDARFIDYGQGKYSSGFFSDSVGVS